MAVVVISAAVMAVYFQNKKDLAKTEPESKSFAALLKEEVEDKYSISIKSAQTVLKLCDSKVARILWEISGPSGTISHTAIYYDYSSHAGDLDGNVTAYLAKYPNFTNQYASKEEAIPKTFDANLSISKAGTLYFRAHSIIGGKHYWTDEKSIAIEK
ncbi:MAG: hypothetical protein WC788_02350 [Candidatus Paceibacterota bacterium]|jgi:hypothetical protein